MWPTLALLLVKWYVLARLWSRGAPWHRWWRSRCCCQRKLCGRWGLRQGRESRGKAQKSRGDESDESERRPVLLVLVLVLLLYLALPLARVLWRQLTTLRRPHCCEH